MSMETYQRLIDEFCAIAEIDNPALLVPKGVVMFNDTPVQMEFIPQMAFLRIMVSLAAQIKKPDAALYRNLLACNFDNVVPWLPVFATHPTSGEVVMIFQTQLQEVSSGEDLVLLLTRQIDFAKTVLNDFIDDLPADEGSNLMTSDSMA
jgi:hypothetical protein